MIGILDYGVGNLLNLKNALDHLDLENRLITNANELQACTRVLLPGVGAFSPAMRHLRQSGMLEVLRKKINDGTPLLGICLGAQLLLGESRENGVYAGLNWIPGKVRRFDHDLKIPQMGWNQVCFAQQDPLFRNIPDTSYFYFVHSYYMCPENADTVLGTTDYAHPFASVVRRNNVWGVQFHPEKSQNPGLELLRNFCTMQ